MRSLLLALALGLVADAAAAQLTPAQRAERERRPDASKSTQLMDSWERRALDGDPTPYLGPAGRDDRLRARQRLREDRIRTMGRDATPQGPRNGHRMEIGLRELTPRTLRRADGQRFEARARVPLKLTLVSPIGGPDRGLMIRTAIGRDAETPEWSRMAEVVADRHGNYLVDVPPFAPGDYELLVEVYDLDQPEAPYSTSRTPLVIREP